jgi:HlyD family secretion protein
LAFNYRSDAEQFAVNQADAQLQSQIAQSQNLTTGARPEEIASLQAQLKSAQAQLLLAKQTLQRFQMLQRSGAVAQVQVDEMVAQVKTAQASVDSIQAQIRAANLPARKQTLTASIATSKAAKAALEKAQYDLSQLNVNSELAGEVSQVYYHTGEYVTQGQPIVQILPHANRKVIFYIPQDKLSTLRVGQVVNLQGIGSQQSLSNASIRYISPQASYTPPVIYSNENADKLTFRVEGVLNSTGNTPNLQVGQPVQVMFE